MMVIKGNGGEGKSQIGAVLSAIFGTNMKDGSIGKISENRFARADLEHILLCVDDDMRMEALRQTNYVKSIVTAQGKMDLERKGKQILQRRIIKQHFEIGENLHFEVDFYNNDLKNGIHETTEFLGVFLRNLLLNENHPLYNQILHISGTFKEPEKVNIDSEKVNIGSEKVNIDSEKVNIEEDFTAKTASHVRKLQEALGKEIVFGRSDVQRVLDLKPTRCTALLREMAEHGIIEPVTGHGKGKYRFRQP